VAGELPRLRTRGQIRVSDAERERAVETLRDHYADGRLGSDELEEIEQYADAAGIDIWAGFRES